MKIEPATAHEKAFSRIPFFSMTVALDHVKTACLIREIMQVPRIRFKEIAYGVASVRRSYQGVRVGARIVARRRLGDLPHAYVLSLSLRTLLATKVMCC